MIYILSIIFSGLLVFLSLKEYQKSDSSIQIYFIPGLAFKLSCGIGIGLLYSQYYLSGDTFTFFEDGERIAALATRNPLEFLKFIFNGNEDYEVWGQLKGTQPRALFFSKLTAIGYWTGFGNYWGVAFFFSFLSFFSSWKLVRTIIRFFPDTKTAAVTAFLFFPSVVFWSSGLMKESIAMAGLYLVVTVFLTIWIRRQVDALNLIIGVTGFWLLWNLKYYFAGVLLIVMLGIIIVKLIVWVRPIKHPVKVTVLFLLILIVPLILVAQLHPNFYLSRILEVVVKNYDAYREISKPENLISYYQLKATPGSILINMPWAMISGIFQPFLWNVKTTFQFFAGLETFTVLILFIGAFKHSWKVLKTSDFLLLLGTIMFIGMLATFLALSTPNIGTLVRYRVGFYPFLIFLLILANPWLKNWSWFTRK